MVYWEYSPAVNRMQTFIYTAFVEEQSHRSEQSLNKLWNKLHPQIAPTASTDSSTKPTQLFLMPWLDPNQHLLEQNWLIQAEFGNLTNKNDNFCQTKSTKLSTTRHAMFKCCPESHHYIVSCIHDYPITANTSDSLYMIRANSFPWKILPNSAGQLAKFRGKIVQIPWLVTASHLWLKTERAVQKLQLLEAGIVLLKPIRTSHQQDSAYQP